MKNLVDELVTDICVSSASFGKIRSETIILYLRTEMEFGSDLCLLPQRFI